MAAQVLKVMEEKSGDVGGASFARQGALTIRSLSLLLQQSEGATDASQLSLKVPLLGNISIRRNANRSQAPPPTAQQQPQMLPSPALWSVFPHQASQSFENASLNQGPLPPATMQEQADWQYNPLSWSIEDNHDSAFQDVFVADNWDQFGAMQGDYNNFQMQ